MKKRILKKIYRHPRFVAMSAHIYVMYLCFVYYTCRKTYENYHNLQQIWDGDNGIILCFWHSRLMLLPYVKLPKDDRTACAFISPHRDGKYSTAIAEYHKATPIYGSSNKGAKRALKEALRHLKNRAIIFMTPDGPRGPANIATAGAVQMSHLSDSWIIPTAYSCSRKIIINSWDKLLLPLPFGTIHYTFDEAFKKSQFENTETCRLHLQTRLNEITEIADKACE